MFSLYVLVATLALTAQASVLQGNVGARVINGQLATANQFPWHAIIEGTQLNNLETLCGGALISNVFVLTAAHCIAGTNFQFFHVGLGATNLSRPLVRFEINHNIATNRIIHPQYNANTNLNDLGLLRLPIQVPNIAGISTIRLPALSQANTLFTDVTAVFSGFGRVAIIGNVSERLRFTETRVLLQTQCQQVYGTAIAHVNTLCTVGREFDVQGACANDNGGPLVLYEANNTPTLIGVQLFIAQAGCIAGQPVGYVRLGTFVQWISTTAGIPTRA